MRRGAVWSYRDIRTFDISCRRSNRWAWSNLCVGPLHHHLPKALFTGSFTDVIGQAILKAEAKEGLQRPFLEVCIEYANNHLKLKLWTEVADIKDPLNCLSSCSDFSEAPLAEDSRNSFCIMNLLTTALISAALAHAATVKESLYIQNMKVNPDGFIIRSWDFNRFQLSPLSPQICATYRWKY